MKRSETVLVYGVTGLLLVILGIAVIFGNDPTANAAELTAGVGSDPTVLIDDLDDPNGVDPAIDEEEVPVDDPAATDPEPEPEPEPEVVSPLSMEPGVPHRTVNDVLGESKIVNQYGINAYRLVEARPNESFKTLVEKWTGDSNSHLDLARALNEELDPTALRSGQEVVLPLVEDDVLLAAWQKRMDSRTARHAADLARPRTSGNRATVPASNPRTTPTPLRGTRNYVVKKGESLWKIAANEVGAAEAQKYINEIVALNNLLNPDRIGAGTKLLLPPRR